MRSLDNSLRSAPATEFHESTPAHIPVLGVVTSSYVTTYSGVGGSVIMRVGPWVGTVVGLAVGSSVVGE